MKKSIPQWQMAGFVFVSIAGTLLHFAFDWSGQRAFAGLFSAVNESIWEHMKLIFYPMALFALVAYRFWGKEHPRFWCTKFTGILTALLLIPMLYYTYTGILGVSIDWLNITIFFLAAGAAFWLETHIFLQNHPCRLPARTAMLLMILMAITFTVFTFRPPEIPFFLDPVTKTYGLQR